MENTRETRVNRVASESHQSYGNSEMRRCRRSLHGYKKLSGFEYLCMFVGMLVVMFAIAWAGMFILDKFMTWVTPAVEALIDLMYGKMPVITMGIAGVSLIALLFLPCAKDGE